MLHEKSLSVRNGLHSQMLNCSCPASIQGSCVLLCMGTGNHVHIRLEHFEQPRICLQAWATHATAATLLGRTVQQQRTHIVYVCMYVCMCIYIYIRVHASTHMYIYTYICVYIYTQCMYVCVYVQLDDERRHVLHLSALLTVAIS